VNPRVSVVIVSYKSRDALEPCLDSLATCAKRIALEVVVVDNASSDGTVEWLRANRHEVDLIANPDNRGFTRGVNQGLARARGDFLFVLNPDCEVAPEALERLVHELEHTPGVAAVAPLLLDGGGHAARSCGRFPDLWTLFCDHLGLAQKFPDSALFGRYKYGGKSMDQLDRVEWASGAALLIPRRGYDEVGGLDENIFMYMEEVDWCRRAARVGLAVRVVAGASILHHGQRSSRQVPGQTYLHNLRSRVYYFRKHHGPIAAVVAKGILLASLGLKWSVAAARASRHEFARVYAAGLSTVWAA
jgi:N-acetylglucosaminyl-diphospho-decaprenol L-rhamnosyltransferase